MGHISVDGYEPAHLSYSTINSYRMCPKQFQLNKVVRLEERPGLASTGGSAVHLGTEWIDFAEFYGRPIEEIVAEDLDNRSSVRHARNQDTETEE